MLMRYYGKTWSPTKVLPNLSKARSAALGHIFV